MRILMKAMSLTGDRVPYAVSIALVVVAILTSGTSFLFWGVFDRDEPMTVGNMRGTALAMLVIAVPLLVGSMIRSSRGSPAARSARRRTQAPVRRVQLMQKSHWKGPTTCAQVTSNGAWSHASPAF
jgi:hypothetical protein